MAPTITKREVDKSRYSEKVIFTYSIKHLLKKDKVRFYYAIKGRDGKTGVVKEWKIEQLGRAVLLAPIKHEKDVAEFLTYWKCRFQSKRVLVEK